MSDFRYFIKVLPILLVLGGIGGPLGAQPNGEGSTALIGLTLGEVLSRFGVPQAVYPVRGREEWQDDVVFEYENQDLYIYRDRVWQLGLKTAYGITLGDSRQLVLLVLGERAQVFSGYIQASLPGESWPLKFRVNMDPQDKVSGLFIYRSDF
ncbi:MAG: hypothetical protein LBB78_12255 [Spirochaetaceae bacterium]|jgi:hypothetical protein|nr:hypothetical protein [Spirochaetaceae bacterium]